MNSARVWVLILAATCFAAGLALGVLLGTRERRPALEEGAFPDYRRMLVAEFDLSPAREEALRDILESYARDMEGVKNSRMSDYLADIEPGLRELGERYTGYIRDDLIPADERERFDRLCEARDLNLLDR